MKDPLRALPFPENRPLNRHVGQIGTLAKYFEFYNNNRRHQGLMDRQTPWQAYAGVSLGQAA